MSETLEWEISQPGRRDEGPQGEGLTPNNKHLTASQAIRRECRRCGGVTPEQCWTRICKLSPNVYECRSKVKRIRAHCLDCAALDIGETPFQAVKSCNGLLLRGNPGGNVCFLHPYRFGKNPNRPKYKLTSANLAFRSRRREQKQGK
jgi:hypothetical protein